MDLARNARSPGICLPLEVNSVADIALTRTEWSRLSTTMIVGPCNFGGRHRAQARVHRRDGDRRRGNTELHATDERAFYSN